MQRGTGKAWDLKLSSFHANRKCNSKKSEYNAIVNNCYDYVTEFLNFVGWNNHSKHTKEEIIEMVARAEHLARRRLSSNVETSYAAIVLNFFSVSLWCDISRKINRLIVVIE